MSGLPLEPDDAQRAAAMLAEAAADGRTLTIEGGRTRLQTAAQHQTISSCRLTNGLAHYAGDLVASVPAGVTMAQLNAALAAQGQWLPLDPRFPDRATIGGIVAANDSGPRRHRYGSPRDLIIGIEVALPNGRVVHSGGRVVKNVAGYDLARLFCGSHGSLGMITGVTFKLAPLPATSRTLGAHFAGATEAAFAALALAASPLTPSTIELVAPPARLLVCFETTLRAADQMATDAAARLSSCGADVAMLSADEEARAWRDHAALEATAVGLLAAVSVLPTAAPATLKTAATLAERFGLSLSATGRVALGLLNVRVQGDIGAQARFAAALRENIATDGGHLHVISGPPEALASVRPWADLGTAAALGLAVKQRFDPAAVLPYPWASN
jgi:glycolate oxidase FAD binding subunit